MFLEKEPFQKENIVFQSHQFSGAELSYEFSGEYSDPCVQELPLNVEGIGHVANMYPYRRHDLHLFVVSWS